MAVIDLRSSARSAAVGRGSAIVVHSAAVLLGVVFALPFAWAISTSLKMPNEVYSLSIEWIPSPVRWANYAQALTIAPFGRYFLNTLTLAVAAGIGRVFVSAIIAYGFARFRFPGRGLLFALVLSTMMIPQQVLLVPRFLLFNLLRWTDTFLPLTVPAYFGATPFVIFLGRQFFMSLPGQIEEAAEIDGAGPLQTLVRVVLPLSRPFIATAAILSFQWDWNAFLPQLVYLQSETRHTVAIGLQYLRTLSGGVDMAGQPMDHLIMAASIAVTIPIVIVFLLFQKYFVRGVVMTGIKG